MWEAAENEVLRRRDAGLDGGHQELSPVDIGTVYSSDTVALPYNRFIAGIANVAFHATLHIRAASCPDEDCMPTRHGMTCVKQASVISLVWR
jgi:hypothetical protein